MVSKIINLTRAVIPRISANSKKNMEAINSMPEMVLAGMIRNGDRSIVHVDMNHCAVARISENGINTIYTDALCGCNSVGIVTKAVDGKPVALLSHYVPTNVDGQVNAIERQLATYNDYLDKNYTPKLFFNVRGGISNDKLVPVPNPIIDKVKALISKFFPKGAESTITPYSTKQRTAFFSSANIFQFDPADVNKLKITNVGEKESFVNL